MYGPLGAKKKQGSGRSLEILMPYCHAQGTSATTQGCFGASNFKRLLRNRIPQLILASGSPPGPPGLPKSPRDQSKPRFILILGRFLMFFVISYVMWATFCRVCLVSFFGCSMNFISLFRSLLFKFVTTGSSF